MKAEHAGRWARDHLVDLVEIESFSHHEQAAAAYLSSLVEELGLPVSTHPVDGAGPNLLIGWQPDPALLLTAHMDTIVPAWDWDGHAQVRGDLVYGLGAQDDKGCVIACVLAMLLARDAGADLARLPVGVALTVDEEVSGSGSITMASALRPDYVVGTEGTDLQLGLAEAGILDAWVDVRGRHAHGSLAELGDNAIVKAARLVIELDKLPVTGHVHPLLGRNAFSVYRISGGSELYVIPERARFRMQVRLGSGAAEAFAQVQALCERWDASLELVELAERFETPPGAALPRLLAGALQAEGLACTATGMPSWTDAHAFVDRSGSQAVVFGPGSLGVAHHPDEHVSVAEVVSCARVLARVIAGAAALPKRSPDRHGPAETVEDGAVHGCVARHAESAGLADHPGL